MEEYDVDLAGLQQMADHFCTCDYPYFEELREAMKLLRFTGCRVTEIFDIGRWQVLNGYQVRFQPQKLNYYRYLTLTSEFDNFRNAILGQYPPFLGRTVSQLQNLFKRVNVWGGIMSGDKPISLYLFRYLFIRNLQKDGLTDQQIAEVMGYTTTHVISNYLGAEIISPTPVEPPGIVIGDQTWKIKNLDIDDGQGGIYAYNNDESLVSKYGRLYTFDAAMRVAATVSGYHVPSSVEFTELINSLGGQGSAGGPLKEAGFEHWDSPNTGATNETGFTALPAGYYNYNYDTFERIRSYSYYWSSSFKYAGMGFYVYLKHTYAGAILWQNPTDYGFSVRLLKD